MITARRSGGSLQFLTGLQNPLAPGVIVGLGKDGVIALWRDSS